jgi:hypothetical protein
VKECGLKNVNSILKEYDSSLPTLLYSSTPPFLAQEDDIIIIPRKDRDTCPNSQSLQAAANTSMFLSSSSTSHSSPNLGGSQEKVTFSSIYDIPDDEMCSSNISFDGVVTDLPGLIPFRRGCTLRTDLV